MTDPIDRALERMFGGVLHGPTLARNRDILTDLAAEIEKRVRNEIYTREINREYSADARLAAIVGHCMNADGRSDINLERTLILRIARGEGGEQDKMALPCEAEAATREDADPAAPDPLSGAVDWGYDPTRGR